MKHIDVTAGIIWRDNEFLITQRLNNDPTVPGLWEFPGGKLEDGETLEECLARELKEELDIEVSVGKQVFVNDHEYPNKVIRLIFFIVDYISGEIKLNDHEDAKWISVAEIDAYEFAPADIPVLAKLQNGGI